MKETFKRAAFRRMIKNGTIKEVDGKYVYEKDGIEYEVVKDGDVFRVKPSKSND